MKTITIDVDTVKSPNDVLSVVFSNNNILKHVKYYSNEKIIEIVEECFDMFFKLKYYDNVPTFSWKDGLKVETKEFIHDYSFCFIYL